MSTTEDRFQHIRHRKSPNDFEAEYLGGEDEYLKKMESGRWELVGVWRHGDDKEFYWKRPFNDLDAEIIYP